MHLENAAGAWDGTATGIADSHGDTMVMWFTGTGSYKGLAYFELVTAVDPSTGSATSNDNVLATRGLIFPGPLPTP